MLFRQLPGNILAILAIFAILEKPKSLELAILIIGHGHFLLFEQFLIFSKCHLSCFSNFKIEITAILAILAIFKSGFVKKRLFSKIAIFGYFTCGLPVCWTWGLPELLLRSSGRGMLFLGSSLTGCPVWA